ncbi:MAG TPA: Co2+/Mg2+ efflux protein ApaG [Beijerinckiaceae bacterium]|nr:Co2+/Mg2+ efflux protein ApaG [Beijerinckiaceae bacterium]
MYRAVTDDIEVVVRPQFSQDRSQPEKNQYFWTYDVEITNHGDETVQLRHRHWEITDGNGQRQDVRGPGVVGEQPILKPGDTFRYASGCPLSTPQGIMVGEYEMVDAQGRRFQVQIPAFSLDSPFEKRQLN